MDIQHNFRAHYDLYDQIGRGSTCIVRAATRKRDGRACAVKIMKVGTASASAKMKIVMKEVEILQRLRHPHIVELFDVFVEDVVVPVTPPPIAEGSSSSTAATPPKITRYYLIFMELADGGELIDAIIKAGTFPEGRAARVIASVLSAVAYLHEKGIVHRDLKPENLLCTRKLVAAAAASSSSSSSSSSSAAASASTSTSASTSAAATKSSAHSALEEQVKVADFGLAALLGEAWSDFAFGQAEMRTCCGTPHYAAPEVLLGGSGSGGRRRAASASKATAKDKAGSATTIASPYTERVDIWSLGVILWILLVGFPPPWVGKVKDIVRNFRSTKPSRVWPIEERFTDAKWKAVSAPAKALIAAMLSKDPRARPSAVEALNSPWIRLHMHGNAAAAGGGGGGDSGGGGVAAAYASPTRAGGSGAGSGSMSVSEQELRANSMSLSEFQESENESSASAVDRVTALRRFNARRRLRGGMRAVLAMQRFIARTFGSSSMSLDGAGSGSSSVGPGALLLGMSTDGGSSMGSDAGVVSHSMSLSSSGISAYAGGSSECELGGGGGGGSSFMSFARADATAASGGAMSIVVEEGDEGEGRNEEEKDAMDADDAGASREVAAPPLKRARTRGGM